MALLASGALGAGRVQRLGLRALAAVMLARALVGGNPALAAMGLPPAGPLFQRLDRHFYRPVTALLGVSLWLSARALHGTHSTIRRQASTSTAGLIR